MFQELVTAERERRAGGTNETVSERKKREEEEKIQWRDERRVQDKQINKSSYFFREQPVGNTEKC